MNKFLLAAFLLCAFVVSVAPKKRVAHKGCACRSTCLLVGHLKAQCHKKRGTYSKWACYGGVAGYCKCYCSNKESAKKDGTVKQCNRSCNKRGRIKGKCSSKKSLFARYACYGGVGGWCKCHCKKSKTPIPGPKTLLVSMYKHPGCTKCAPCFHACMPCVPCIGKKSRKCGACYACTKCMPCLKCLNWSKTQVAY